MKFSYLILILVILSVSAFAVTTRECLDRVEPNTNCSIISNAGTDCNSIYFLINVTNITDSTQVENATLQSIGYNGLCYATFLEGTGDYVVVFNITNETRRIVVDGNTNDQIITEVDSVEENQATLLSRISDLWSWLFGTRTESYYNNSLGYPTKTIITYANGTQANESYIYLPDNMTISNLTIEII